MIINPPNHYLFQMANSLLFISYLSSNILMLRVCLAFASICFSLWGALILDIAIDTVVWNGLFACINTLQALIILYNSRPIKFKQPEFETIYQHYFKEDKLLSRSQFKLLVDSAQVKRIGSNCVFANIGDISKQLSLVLSGSLIVIRQRPDSTTQLLTEITSFDFVDSPEFVARNTCRGSEFEVIIKTITPCTYVSWSFEALDKVFKSSEGGTVKHVLYGIVGEDLAKKVFASNSSLWMQAQESPRRLGRRGCIPEQGTTEREGNEKLLVKQNGSRSVPLMNEASLTASALGELESCGIRKNSNVMEEVGSNPKHGEGELNTDENAPNEQLLSGSPAPLRKTSSGRSANGLGKMNDKYEEELEASELILHFDGTGTDSPILRMYGTFSKSPGVELTDQMVGNNV